MIIGVDDACGPEREQWRRRAACYGLPAELFFGPDSDDVHPAPPWDPAPAKAVCRTCPVRQECGDWAVVTRQDHGVWGGSTAEELRRRWRRRSSRTLAS